MIDLQPNCSETCSMIDISQLNKKEKEELKELIDTYVTDNRYREENVFGRSCLVTLGRDVNTFDPDYLDAEDYEYGEEIDKKKLIEDKKKAKELMSKCETSHISN